LLALDSVASAQAAPLSLLQLTEIHSCIIIINYVGDHRVLGLISLYYHLSFFLL